MGIRSSLGRCSSPNLVRLGGSDSDDNDNDAMVPDRTDTAGNAISAAELSSQHAELPQKEGKNTTLVRRGHLCRCDISDEELGGLSAAPLGGAAPIGRCANSRSCLRDPKGAKGRMLMANRDDLWPFNTLLRPSACSDLGARCRGDEGWDFCRYRFPGSIVQLFCRVGKKGRRFRKLAKLLNRAGVHPQAEARWVGPERCNGISGVAQAILQPSFCGDAWDPGGA